jgi:upstream activation factor subunit UAF30
MVKTTTPATAAAPKATKKATKEVAAPAPAVEATTEAPAPEAGEAATDRSDLSAELNDDIAELLKTYQARVALDNSIKASIKAIEKKVAKMTKLMEKSTKKRKTNANKVSGFEKPTAISDELAKFVGEPIGTMLARTAVSKKIHEYVKSNNLQNPNNRRIITPDAKLKKLLKTTGTEELSYFNLQKYLKVHFKKETK